MKDKEQEPMVMVPMSVLKGQITPWDMFAAAALSGILANKRYDPPRRKKISGMVQDAIDAADVMMEQRKARMG